MLTLKPPFERSALRRERVPEVRSGLGVRVGQRADLAVVERPDVLVDQLRRGPQHERGHGADVHDVTHRRGRAAVARQRLADHRERHVVLTEPAVLLGHRERQKAVLGEDLEVAARVEQLVVRALRVGAHLALAEVDQLRAQLLLPLGQEPVGIPVVAESPEGLAAPHLVRHSLSLVGARSSYKFVQTTCIAPRRVCPPGPGPQPSGAIQTRQSAWRRSRRAVSRKRAPA